jgi:hypothetical protein
MTVAIIIFMIVATIFALASLAYVGVDLCMEHRGKKVAEAQASLVEQQMPAESEKPAEVAEASATDP